MFYSTEIGYLFNKILSGNILLFKKSWKEQDKQLLINYIEETNMEHSQYAGVLIKYMVQREDKCRNII